MTTPLIELYVDPADKNRFEGKYVLYVLHDTVVKYDIYDTEEDAKKAFDETLKDTKTKIIYRDGKTLEKAGTPAGIAQCQSLA